MKKSTSFLVKIGAAVAALFAVTVVTAPPGFAAPTLNVSQLTGLTDGQKLTVSGGGFKANLSSIAIGQCRAGYTGPADCNTATGATFRTADANGSVGSFTIIVKEKFGTTDCTKVQCVIAAAPLPNAVDAATVKANEVIHDISFGAVAEETPTTPAPEATAPVATAPESGDTLPKTGAGDNLRVAVWGGGILVLLSGGVLLTMRGAGARR